MKRLCYKCFSELPENANYCPICGEPMREQEKKIPLPLKVTDKAIHVKGEVNSYETGWSTKAENRKIREETLKSFNLFPTALVGEDSTICVPSNPTEGRSVIYEQITDHEYFQRKEIKKEAKERHFRIRIDPESPFAEEIMYQTTILKEILDKLYVLQSTGSTMINTQEFARAVRGVCNEEKEKEGEPDEL